MRSLGCSTIPHPTGLPIRLCPSDVITPRHSRSTAPAVFRARMVLTNMVVAVVPLPIAPPPTTSVLFSARVLLIKTSVPSFEKAATPPTRKLRANVVFVTTASALVEMCMPPVGPRMLELLSVNALSVTIRVVGPCDERPSMSIAPVQPGLLTTPALLETLASCWLTTRGAYRAP